ncbi:FG-GAP repeat protein [Candidatus Sumerlaeota bacterium]|nr:FG-GAP repeat protein [Candidatus Sumerlaeota bacterium]
MKKRFVVSILAGLSAVAGAVPTVINSTDRTLEIHGPATGEYYGRPQLFIDLDNDGFQDLVTGADRSNFSGGERRTLRIFKGSVNMANQGLVDLANASPDSVVIAETDGLALATALAKGDVNDDGIEDLIMADPRTAPNGRTAAGTVYILFGAANFFATPSRDFASGDWDVKISGAAAGDNTGGSTIFGGGISQALASGDFDNDGIDDIAIGAHLSNGAGPETSGAVRIVKGRTPFAHGTTIDLLSQANYSIFGDDTDDQLGTTIAAGDINGDGIDDLAISVPYASVGTFTNEGYVYVMFGRTPFPVTTNLGSTAPSVQIRGAEAGEEVGESLAIADVNNDTIGDIIFGAPGWDGAASNNAFGSVYVFLGRTTWTASMTTASASSVVRGYASSIPIGKTVAAGDVNEDGFADFLFASRDTGRAGAPTEGRTFGIFGAATLAATYSLQAEQVDLIINGNLSGLQLGDFISTGDPDGDGADEILLAAPFVESSTGRVYLFDLTSSALGTTGWVLYE